MSRSERAIEKLVLGELSEAEAKKLREQPGVAEREAALRASNEEILRMYPAERMAAQIRRRANKRPQVVAWAGALATACVLAVVLSTGDEPTERSKGGPSLAVWRKTSAEPELLKDGALVKAGDVLQVTYTARGARYGAIASLDGKGVLTWHLPSKGDEAVELARVPTTLDSAYELDSAPGFERFVLITSASAFALSQVAFAPSGPLTLPDGLTQASVRLVKE